MFNWFKKKELTISEVIDYLHRNPSKIDDKVAEAIMTIVVKSKANKVLFYRILDEAQA